jgi:hypothetical protein
VVSLLASTPILTDVLHAPDMGLTIVSADRICKTKNSVRFRDDACTVTIKNKDNKVIVVYPSECERAIQGRARIRGHNHVGARQLPNAALLTLSTSHRPPPLSARSSTKAQQKAYNSSMIIAHRYFATRVSTQNPCGNRYATEHQVPRSLTPLARRCTPTRSLGGRKCHIVFIDDATRYTMLTVLRSKDEALH